MWLAALAGGCRNPLLFTQVCLWTASTTALTHNLVPFISFFGRKPALKHTRTNTPSANQRVQNQKDRNVSKREEALMEKNAQGFLLPASITQVLGWSDIPTLRYLGIHVPHPQRSLDEDGGTTQTLEPLTKFSKSSVRSTVRHADKGCL
ncbi:hypothetical protein P154DRAFT_32404 [Amniculicola lignicola CBS 123094]|uniref:Uncharacterized protein n=1 Tax=Amniculicola lignicola CBS 123094 TaxID=1392246 RepID=A0A6A5W9U6_9PLEO|nr:hypothetical protein P154DRAFT_32404 [Amniculicola lignicola CBS 123094]